jgi:hypothetical protein
MEKHMIVVNDRYKHYMMKMDNWNKLIGVERSSNVLEHKRQQREEFVLMLLLRPNAGNARKKKTYI